MHDSVIQQVAGFPRCPAMNVFEVPLTVDGDELWTIGDGIRLELPPSMTPRLATHPGNEAIMGLRPVAFRIATDRDAADLDLEIVKVTERNGSFILLDGSVSQTTIVAAVEPTVLAATTT
jgi:hypothetical protein